MVISVLIPIIDDEMAILNHNGNGRYIAVIMNERPGVPETSSPPEKNYIRMIRRLSPNYSTSLRWYPSIMAAHWDHFRTETVMVEEEGGR